MHRVNRVTAPRHETARPCHQGPAVSFAFWPKTAALRVGRAACRQSRAVEQRGGNPAAAVHRYGSQKLPAYRPVRLDEAPKKRYTTVEVVVAEGEWEPIARPPRVEAPPVLVRIAWGEKELARRVKDAGGRWDAGRKLWQLPAAGDRELRLEDRVVPDVSGV